MRIPLRNSPSSGRATAGVAAQRPAFASASEPGFRESTSPPGATDRQPPPRPSSPDSPPRDRFREPLSRVDRDLERDILLLTRRASMLRCVRGGFARTLLANKAWNEFGFVRVGDYTRERLGLSRRTIEEEARVARAFDRLPRIAAAFLTAELSWTQVRLLTIVATERDERFWIETARSCSTRDLEARIRKSPPIDADASLPKDEETVRFSVRVSREGRRLWRAACELAERSAGTPLTQAKVLELVVAEAASGAPLRQPAHSRDAEACGGGTTHAPPDACDAHAEDHSIGATHDPLDASEAHGGGATPDPLEAREAHDGVATPAPLEAADEKTGAEPFDRDPELTAFLADARAGEALFDLHEARDPVSVDARLREIGAAMQRIDADLGRLLCQAVGRRIYRDHGFRTFDDYVDARLDFCARKAWTLIGVERATSRCPEFAAAYREGRLTLMAADRLLRVMGSAHGKAWIERAGQVTLRRLEAEVAWALDRRDAASGADAFDAPAPPPLDHDLRADAMSVLDADRLQMRAQGDAPAATASMVTMHFHVPSAVAGLAEDTLLALRRGTESRGSAFERMLATVLLEWMSAPKHRDPVFERDGWRCAVPACGSRRNLHDHHIRFRSHGGGNTQDNRVTVCAAHHLHSLHTGRIRAHGMAPSGIVWEFEWARLLGDRYLMRA